VVLNRDVQGGGQRAVDEHIVVQCAQRQRNWVYQKSFMNIYLCVACGDKEEMVVLQLGDDLVHVQ